VSALFHSHAVQDEFVFVLEGQPTIVFGDNEYELSPGDCMGLRREPVRPINRSIERLPS
jgi:uncharacterized cupin superfamily protein